MCLCEVCHEEFGLVRVCVCHPARRSAFDTQSGLVEKTVRLFEFIWIFTLNPDLHSGLNRLSGTVDQ